MPANRFVIDDAKTLDSPHGLVIQGRHLMPAGRGVKYWSQDLLVVLADEALNDEITLLWTLPSFDDRNAVLQMALWGPCILLNVPQRAGTLPIDTCRSMTGWLLRHAAAFSP